MTEEIWTFQAPEGTGYYTMHDGTTLTPDTSGRITTTNPNFAASLRVLGATEIQQAPAAATEAGPEDISPDAAALEISAQGEEEPDEEEAGAEQPAKRRRKSTDAPAE